MQKVCRWLVENGAEDTLLACKPVDLLCLAITNAAGAIHFLCFLSNTMHNGQTNTFVTRYAACADKWHAAALTYALLIVEQYPWVLFNVA